MGTACRSYRVHPHARLKELEHFNFCLPGSSWCVVWITDEGISRRVSALCLLWHAGFETSFSICAAGRTRCSWPSCGKRHVPSYTTGATERNRVLLPWGVFWGVSLQGWAKIYCVDSVVKRLSWMIPSTRLRYTLTWKMLTFFEALVKNGLIVISSKFGLRGCQLLRPVMNSIPAARAWPCMAHRKWWCEGLWEWSGCMRLWDSLIKFDTRNDQRFVGPDLVCLQTLPAAVLWLRPTCRCNALKTPPSAALGRSLN